MNGIVAHGACRGSTYREVDAGECNGTRVLPISANGAAVGRLTTDEVTTDIITV